jgi:hypothetical protein
MKWLKIGDCDEKNSKKKIVFLNLELNVHFDRIVMIKKKKILVETIFDNKPMLWINRMRN